VKLPHATSVTRVQKPLGSPYLNVAQGLAPGAHLTIALTFSTAPSQPIAFGLHVFAGPGTR
jgi:hypothetical protein